MYMEQFILLVRLALQKMKSWAFFFNQSYPQLETAAPLHPTRSLLLDFQG